MMIRPQIVALAALAALACATPAPVKHGTITTMSAATSADSPRCEHKVPKEVCTRCNPHLVAKFKAAKDWCVEHEVPESQCFECHPDLTFDPLPPARDRRHRGALEGGGGRAFSGGARRTWKGHSLRLLRGLVRSLSQD